MSKPTTAHHPRCPYEYAADVAYEVGGVCNCPQGWPRKVCERCWTRWQKNHQCKAERRMEVQS